MVETEEEEKPHVPVMSQQQEKIYPELMTESSASFDQPSSNNTKEDNKSKTKVEIKGILTVIGGFIVCLSFGSGKMLFIHITVDMQYLFQISAIPI